MNLFDLLLVAHLVGDFLLQTKFEALNKAQGRFFNQAIAVHSVKYTACCALVFWVYGVSLWWSGWVLATHMVIDRRWPTVYWRMYVTRNPPEDIKNSFWLTIVVDQVFHLLVLAVVAVAVDFAHRPQ
jgi:hypothetical protein